MEDTRISDLAKAIMEATTVKEAFDSDNNRMSVGSNRLHIQVTNAVAIIVESEMSPLLDVWIQNSIEGEGARLPRRWTRGKLLSSS